VQQIGREKIASGQAKAPMASIDGELQFVDAPNFDGIEVSFNPKRTHLFIDADGFAIRYAEEVTIHGHRAYLRGQIEYYTASTAPARAGDMASVAKLKQ
jgi:hypothetical protein